MPVGSSGYARPGQAAGRFGRLAGITIQANASDSSGGPVLVAAQVASSEDPEKDGSGNTVPDWTTPVVDQATGIITLSLRAER